MTQRASFPHRMDAPAPSSSLLLLAKTITHPAARSLCCSWALSCIRVCFYHTNKEWQYRQKATHSGDDANYAACSYARLISPRGGCNRSSRKPGSARDGPKWTSTIKHCSRVNYFQQYTATTQSCAIQQWVVICYRLMPRLMYASRIRSDMHVYRPGLPELIAKLFPWAEFIRG